MPYDLRYGRDFGTVALGQGGTLTQGAPGLWRLGIRALWVWPQRTQKIGQEAIGDWGTLELGH